MIHMYGTYIRTFVIVHYHFIYTKYILIHIFIYNIIEFVFFICYAHHTPLRFHFADTGHTFVAKRQAHPRHCVEDNTSTIFK